MMIQAPVPQVTGFFFLRLGGACRCVVADKAELPAAIGHSERETMYVSTSTTDK